MQPTFASSLIISPHLDDAVFSCRDLLAVRPGMLVGTVFTATPEDAGMRTAWDTRCGFADAYSAMSARLAEDRYALDSLAAHGVPLGFLDRQYGASPASEEIAVALEALLAQYRCIAAAIPLGLCHPDHELVHSACLQVLKNHPEIAWLAYEEAPYRRVPGLVQRRLIALAGEGVTATPLGLSLAAAGDCRGMTRRALASYGSQLQGFDAAELAELHLPGRYWQLAGSKAGPLPGTWLAS